MVFPRMQSEVFFGVCGSVGSGITKTSFLSPRASEATAAGKIEVAF